MPPPPPAKLLLRFTFPPDCVCEVRVDRDLTSEEWDELFDILLICRRRADKPAALPPDPPEGNQPS